jgi:predicted DNA-binding WGR domain protein
VQRWGRQGTDGRTRVQFLENREHVQTETAKLLRRRLQHGYKIVTTTASAQQTGSVTPGLLRGRRGDRCLKALVRKKA